MVLKEYLNKLNSHMDSLLSRYTVITYDNEKDIDLGLLRFDKPPNGKAFLFKFQDEKIRIFHTVGMKFPIKIFFFDKDKQIIFSYNDVPPEIEKISSKKPAMYVVEIP